MFDSKNWQEKKQAYTILNNYFVDIKNEDNLNKNSDNFLIFILIKNQLFKENNILIL